MIYHFVSTYKSHSFEYFTVCCVQYDYINSLAMVLGNMKFMMTIDFDIYLVYLMELYVYPNVIR